MTSRIQWSVGLLLVGLALGGIAYLKRVDIALGLAKFAAEQRFSVGPNKDISWATGIDSRGRTIKERPPNIVLILADDLGWNDLSFNGGGVAGGTMPTPHINSIAQQGVSFSNAYAANGTCAPSRAALMSGRYGTRFGFEFTPTPPGMVELGNLMPRGADRLRYSIRNTHAESIPYEDMGMPTSEVTIAELLQHEGYHTVHIGKWHLGLTNGMAAQHQGFDESLLMSSGLYLPEDHPDVVNAKQEFDPIDRFLWAAMRFASAYNTGGENDFEAFEPDGYLTDYYTEQAVEVIEANKDRPFFLYLAHWAPHTPLQALRADYEDLSHIESHRERVYAAMIRSLDRGVGEVLQALKDNGLEDNTLVMFSSDNGGAGYLGLPDVNKPFRGWKISLFEGGIHVPFFARWPARIPADSVFDAPVHHVDLYATAAKAGGASLPSDRKIDGVDLLPFVTGDAEDTPHDALFWRSGASQSALVNGWKLNVSNPPNRSWLFDLNSDPNEQRDLSKARPDKLAELQAALAEHNAEQAPPAWPSRLSIPINIDKDVTRADSRDDDYIYWSN
ncbi:MAG: sulfatase-like hydrolase/transferase [Pseudomonadota bacterium]